MIIITGIAGFIGSHLAEAIIEQFPNEEIIGIDNYSTGFKENLSDNFKEKSTFKGIIECDYSEINKINETLEKSLNTSKISHIFHFAANASVVKSVTNPDADLQNNLVNSVKFLEFCIQKFVANRDNPCKIIFASSSAIFGNANTPVNEYGLIKPLSAYGISKAALELYLEIMNRKYQKLNFISLRLPNVYGERQRTNNETGIIPIIVKNYKKGIPTKIYGYGKARRDYVYISDVIQAIMLCAFNDNNWKYRKHYCNIGSGIATSVLEIYETIYIILNNSQYSNNFLKNPRMYLSHLRLGEARIISLDSTRLRETYGWIPKVSLKEGIEKTVKWCLEDELDTIT